MTAMNNITLDEAIDRLDELLVFYYGAGQKNSASPNVWTSSTAWFDNGVFMRFIQDTEGTRVEIGDKWHGRLMFVGSVKGGLVIYEEVPMRAGRNEDGSRETIRDRLLDRYGCVGVCREGCNATHTDTEWKPRLAKEARS